MWNELNQSPVHSCWGNYEYNMGQDLYNTPVINQLSEDAQQQALFALLM